MPRPLLVAAAHLVISASLLTAPAQPAGAAEGPAARRLSDERTLSRWARPQDQAIARRSPAHRARAVGRLRFENEDGLPETYLALRRLTDPQGRSWVKVRLPARPNGQTGWVPRSALGALHRTTLLLEIDRRSLRATLRRRGRVIWRAPVGVGKAATPTPAGRFWIRSRLRPARGSIYGELAFGTSAYAVLSDWPGGGVVGIHGTNQPKLIPGRPSHGCVRVRPDDLRRLGRLLKVGTPVRIR